VPHSEDSTFEKICEVLEKVSAIETRGEFQDRDMAKVKEKLEVLETGYHRIALDREKMRGFKRQMELLNENVSGMFDNVQSLMRRSQKQSVILDGGVRFVWVIVANLITGAITFIVAVFAFGVNGS